MLTTIYHILSVKFDSANFGHDADQIFRRLLVHQRSLLELRWRATYAVTPRQQPYYRDVPDIVSSRPHRHNRIQKFRHVFLYSLLRRFAHRPQQSFQSCFGTVSISNSEQIISCNVLERFITFLFGGIGQALPIRNELRANQSLTQ